jgi:hypothetical protein
MKQVRKPLERERGASPAAAGLERWRLPTLLFLGSFAIFAIFSGPRLLHQSQAPHFVYQADAFLHGQLSLTVLPPNLNDWARVGDRFFVSFPPLPAVLMMPFVAVFGFQFNDVFFTLVFAAANVALLFLVLRQLSEAADSSRSTEENLALALLFAFGTVNFYCAIRGEVWFTAEVIGVTCTCLYLLAAHRARHPVLAGAAFACGVVTRTPLTFAIVYFAFELLAPGGRWDAAALRPRREEILRKGLLFMAPVAAVALPMAWMNYVRFGNALEFGHAHLFNNRVNSDISRYGLFAYHYLERNLHAAFTRLPLVVHPEAGAPSLSFDPDGMSLFVTTPAFALLLWPRVKPRLHHILWATVAAVSIPGFFYQNTGWRQFGFRFSLDYTPFLFLLLAIGGYRMGRLFWTLAGIGIAVGIWGAVAF